jgi:hypothetical protein
MTIQADPLRAAGSEVAALSDALRRGGGALDSVPDQLEELIDSGSWRHFVTRLGKEVSHARFDEFTRTEPLGGLGASPDLIDRIVGTKHPDLLVKLREVRKGKPGRPRKGTEKALESNAFSSTGEHSDYAADRLAREAPDEYEAVRRGEKSINAAAVAAGIRPRRISVRLDRPDSIVATLRRHLTTEQLAEVTRLLAAA